jgi:hypothetical protein
VKTYKKDTHNANLGTKRGQDLLKFSLERLGAGRSILVDQAGNVIAGNKTLEAAKAVGLSKTVEVETDGSTLVVVKRTDLNLLEHVKARELAYADNKVAEANLAWNADVVNFDLDSLSSDFLKELWTTEDIAKLLESSSMEEELSKLPFEDNSSLTTLTFTLHKEQLDTVNTAIKEAKLALNEPMPHSSNKNADGTALHLICKHFLHRH